MVLSRTIFVLPFHSRKHSVIPRFQMNFMPEVDLRVLEDVDLVFLVHTYFIFTLDNSNCMLQHVK